MLATLRGSRFGTTISTVTLFAVESGHSRPTGKRGQESGKERRRPVLPRFEIAMACKRDVIRPYESKDLMLDTEFGTTRGRGRPQMELNARGYWRVIQFVSEATKACR